MIKVHPDFSYTEMFQRNSPVISTAEQERIQSLKIAVAGCGSTGGAFADGAVRLGVTGFSLADNGTYEVSNLNRQMVDICAIGENKARAYATKLRAINPSCSINVFDEGLTTQNLGAFLDGCQLVFDAVDVTTSIGMEMKLQLHEKAAQMGLPLVSALDLGFTQWIKGFDYRIDRRPLLGLLDEARSAKGPIAALLRGFISIEDLPLEIIDEVFRLLEDDGEASACQLGCACFLLSALVTPYLLSFVRTEKLPPVISVDLLSPFQSSTESEKRRLLANEGRQKLAKILGVK